MNAIKLFVIAAAAGLLIAACGQNSQTPNSSGNSNKGAPATSPATAQTNSPSADVELGAQLYAENCQICHQNTGKGGKNLTIQGKKISPADLTSDKAKKHSDQNLIKDIIEGAPDDGMPPFKDKLSPDQMKQIVTYLRKLQGPPAAPVAL